MKILSQNKLILFLALLKIIIPYFLQNPVYEPHRDELLYLAEGHHMAWGFMEVPPLLSVFAWLTNLFGAGMFWIKFWPSLFGAATFVICAKIVQSLGGRSFAIVLIFLPFIFGVYLRLFFLFQPNTPEVFFWTMIAYSMIRFSQTKNKNFLYLLGISIGLGMLSKYSVAFFTFSIFGGILLTKHRTVFLKKHFWYSMVIAFIIFLPNLLWQYFHHFPVVHHMEVLQRSQLRYISRADFLKDQLLMNLPCFFIWLAGLWFVCFTKSGKEYQFIGYAYFLVLIIFLITHGKNYYALGLYPPLLAFGAYWLEKITAIKSRYLRFAFLFIPIAIGILFIPLALPLLPPKKLANFYEATHMEKTGALKWEDLKNHPLPQDFSDMLGWKEMAEKVSDAYERLDSTQKKETIIFCDNYGIAGAINFYGQTYHLPQAYSDNASFLYWLPDSIQIHNIILLTDDPHDMEKTFVKEFQSAVLNDSINTEYARERGDLVITLIGANEKFQQYFKEKIQKDKDALAGKTVER